MAEPIRVLHVDDDREFAELAGTYLERERERLAVKIETDPTAVPARLTDGDVDCIVSDYDMPRMDGIELLEAVRDVVPDVPFILYTGKGSEEVASEALAKGATDYLQKASGTDQYALLANRVENAVVQYRSVAQLERQSDILEEAQEIADLGVVEFDLDRGEAWFSVGMYRLFDITPPAAAAGPCDLSWEDALTYYHPEDRDAIRAAVERTIENGEPSELEVRGNPEDGEERWFAIQWKPQTQTESTRARATVQDITDRKQRERDLTRTDRRFQAVFDDPQMLVGIMDPDGRIQEANETAVAYFDADVEELRGEPLWSAPWWRDETRSAVREWIQRAADGEYISEEVRIDGPGGDTPTLSGSIRPVTDETGDLTSLIVSARNITQRHSSQEQRDFFETLVAETTDIITVLDDDGVVTYASPAIETVLGYEQSELIGRSPAEWIHPDDHDAVADWYATVVSEAAPRPDPTEYRVRHADGSWRWLEARVKTVSSRALDGHVVTSRDVTARKERERELREFEKIIESLGESLFTLDPDGEMAHVNPAGARITGYDATELLDGGVDLVYDDAETAKFERAIRDLMESEQSVTSLEATLETKDGREVPVEATLSALTDEDGRFAGAIGVIKDISERKQTERQLREYESILRAIPDEVAILDTDGFFERVLPPTGSETTTSGYLPSELEGEHVSETMGEDDLERGVDLIEELVTTDRERAVFEMEVITRDGEHRIREDHLSLLKDADDEIQGTVGVLRDIEERKAYERELKRQNERLEEFASIASHDLRNPLNLAQGYMDMVDAECDSEHTDEVSDALDRMEQLIADTLAWARQGASVDEREPIDLGEIVPECWDAVGSETATLDVVDSMTVHGDPGRVRQVIENLLRNAVEHGGTNVRVDIGALDDGFYVADDGPGVPPEDRDAIFEAGYTTASGGTGFGLAIISEIIEAHGWEIGVTESEAGGARFEITGVAVEPGD